MPPGGQIRISGLVDDRRIPLARRILSSRAWVGKAPPAWRESRIINAGEGRQMLSANCTEDSTSATEAPSASGATSGGGAGSAGALGRVRLSIMSLTATGAARGAVGLGADTSAGSTGVAAAGSSLTLWGRAAG